MKQVLKFAPTTSWTEVAREENASPSQKDQGRTQTVGHDLLREVDESGRMFVWRRKRSSY